MMTQANLPNVHQILTALDLGLTYTITAADGTGSGVIVHDGLGWTVQLAGVSCDGHRTEAEALELINAAIGSWSDDSENAVLMASVCMKPRAFLASGIPLAEAVLKEPLTALDRHTIYVVFDEAGQLVFLMSYNARGWMNEAGQIHSDEDALKIINNEIALARTYFQNIVETFSKASR